MLRNCQIVTNIKRVTSPLMHLHAFCANGLLVYLPKYCPQDILDDTRRIKLEEEMKLLCLEPITCLLSLFMLNKL